MHSRLPQLHIHASRHCCAGGCRAETPMASGARKGNRSSPAADSGDDLRDRGMPSFGQKTCLPLRAASTALPACAAGWSSTGRATTATCTVGGMLLSTHALCVLVRGSTLHLLGSRGAGKPRPPGQPGGHVPVTLRLLCAVRAQVVQGAALGLLCCSTGTSGCTPRRRALQEQLLMQAGWALCRPVERA